MNDRPNARTPRLMLLLALCCAILCAASAALASEPVGGTTDSGLVYQLAQGEITITGYTGASTAVVIPDTLAGHPVRAIGDQAFYQQGALEHVALPASLQRIGSHAFFQCRKLQSITIPDGVTDIGNGAFWYCESITRIALPEGVDVVENYLLANCNSLLEVNLPSRLERIGASAFAYCPKLTSLKLPRVCGQIDASFIACNANTTGVTQLTLPAQWTSVNAEALHNARYLQNVLLPQDAQGLPDAVMKLGTLQNIYTVAGEGAARYADRDGVLYSASGDTLAFYPTGYASAYTIPDGVTAIAADAFSHFATGTITFPASVVTIPDTLAAQLAGGYVVVCEDSPTHAYAQENGLSYSLASEGVMTLQKKVEQVVAAVVTNGMSDYDKALALHDWLVNNAVYDHSMTYRTAEHMLLNGTGVCEGYARAYKLLLDAVDIPCTYVNGYANAPTGQILHAWVVIQLGGQWYHVDPTWNDPNETPGGEHHDYFALSDHAVSYDHAIDWIDVKCTAYADNYDYRAGNLDADLTTLRNGINAALKQGKKQFTVALTGYRAAAALRTMELILRDERFTVDGAPQRLTISSDVVKREYTVVAGELSGDAADYTYQIVNGEVTLTGYRGAKTALTMPASILGMPVTAIADNAFEYKPFTSVTLPDSIRSIGISAFGYCRQLQSIKLPSGITRIAGATFSNCKSLAAVVIPDGVTVIGGWAFSGCGALRSVAFPQALQTIEEEAFSRCAALASVSLPSGVVTIGDYAFMDCDKVQSLAIPDSVTTLGESALCYMDALAQATLGEGILSIPPDTFDGCAKLTSVTLRADTVGIGDRAFSGCASLEVLELPRSATTFGDSAFYGCDSLVLRVYASSPAHDYAAANKLPFKIVDESAQAVKLPGALTAIAANAFRGSALRLIDLRGTRISAIGASAFADCAALVGVWIPKSVQSIDATAFSGADSVTVYCYEGSAAHDFVVEKGMRFMLLAQSEP